MYDFLSGTVAELRATRVVVDVGGVGFDVKVPVSTSTQLRTGEPARLYTILHVVDGAPTLLGFGTPVDRDLARELMTVSGVGPSMTLAILSAYASAQVAQAILVGDHTLLRKVKGVGAKTAERLCLELRDRVAKLDLAGAERPPAAVLLPQSSEDAVAALMVLGYAEKDARQRVGKAAARHADLTTEELIREVLRT